MPRTSEPVPSFNLWMEPWITLERADGSVERHSIEQTLLSAHEYTSIYDPSPLAVVGIHRLLVAILQFALDPQKNADLERLWRASRFSPDKVTAFGTEYAHRFDLFSEKEPLLQSADLPLQSRKGDNTKSVAYLTFDVPAGTAVTHYRHNTEDEHIFCPMCAAAGLVSVPAFATSGGQSIRPSINGVPPLYILPGGRTLFETLAASLVCRAYQPPMASKMKDEVWWSRTPKVKSKSEVREVGYLHSLTFPARRVRLHPERLRALCTRCGGAIEEWGTRTMIFEMGESRPKAAEVWLDPFAAYRLPQAKSKRTVPAPIRPTLGKAIWREYAGLFLRQSGAEQKTRRPSVLDQIAALNADNLPRYFRCVGLQTDGKAKVFEWVDAGFEAPLALLRDEAVTLLIEDAIAYATDCAGILAGTFQKHLGHKAAQRERHAGLKQQMLDDYWAALADPFRHFVLKVPSLEQREAAQRAWADAVFAKGKTVFDWAADSIGDDAEQLRDSETAKKWCSINLAARRKEYANEQ